MLRTTSGLFLALNGRAIASWQATEMALREDGSGGKPLFEDTTIPFLQLNVLDLLLDDGIWIEIECLIDNEVDLYRRPVCCP